MIHIDRSGVQAPKELLEKGPQEIKNTIRPKATAHPPTLTSKDFKPSIYSADSVRKALGKLQNWKCCYCEKPLERSYSTVEHIRPKTSVRNFGQSSPGAPGYWWLGYTFENLLLCCPNCNGPKNDYWPLLSGSRVPAEIMPGDPRFNENNAIIDPSVDFPAEHIDWVFQAGRAPIPRGIDRKGKETLKALKLRERDQLQAHWATHYAKVIVPLVLRWDRGDAQARTEMAAEISSHCSADAPWSGMTRSAFRQANIP